eukprot:SM000001S04446  [mRNA]  locus=s1:222365:224447:+ [translate_table: standard]
MAAGRRTGGGGFARRQWVTVPPATGLIEQPPSATTAAVEVAFLDDVAPAAAVRPDQLAKLRLELEERLQLAIINRDYGHAHKLSEELGEESSDARVQNAVQQLSGRLIQDDNQIAFARKRQKLQWRSLCTVFAHSKDASCAVVDREQAPPVGGHILVQHVEDYFAPRQPCTDLNLEESKGST